MELLVLSGALDIDYIGNDDDEDASSGGNNGKSLEVEATALFMLAFLLSIFSKHKDALSHLQKF